ncbi:hypothetical protein ACLOJK_021285 [Asimina triloba]
MRIGETKNTDGNIRTTSGKWKYMALKASTFKINITDSQHKKCGLKIAEAQLMELFSSNRPARGRSLFITWNQLAGLITIRNRTKIIIF